MASKDFDWSQYFALANELAARPEESCLRTAIGRAYYYVFHLARQRIMENQFPIIPGTDSHKQIWEKFDNSADVACKKLYSLAKVLKEKRQRADYESAYPRLEDDLPVILDAAKRFAETLVKLPPGLPRNLGVRR
jgi:hypothetical protein